MCVCVQAVEKILYPHLLSCWSNLQLVLDDCSVSNSQVKDDGHKVYGAIVVSGTSICSFEACLRGEAFTFKPLGLRWSLDFTANSHCQFSLMCVQDPTVYLLKIVGHHVPLPYLNFKFLPGLAVSFGNILRWDLGCVQRLILSYKTNRRL